MAERKPTSLTACLSPSASYPSSLSWMTSSAGISSARAVDRTAAVMKGRGLAYVHYKHDETIVAMGMDVHYSGPMTAAADFLDKAGSNLINWCPPRNRKEEP